MAEVIGVVASGISIAQITFQFIGCAHKLQQLRDLPNELQSIVTDLELLRRVLSPLVSALESSDKVDASSENLYASVLHCNEVASSLCKLATKLNKNLNGSIVKRSLGMLNTGLRKDEIRTMETRLESSKTLLLLAMAANMHHQHSLLGEAFRTTSVNIAHMNQLLEKASLVEKPRTEDKIQASASKTNVQNYPVPEIRSRKYHNRWSTQCYCVCHLSSEASRGVYPLFAIAKRFNPELLRLCLKGGSLVNQQDRWGHSVLHLTTRWLQYQLPIPRNCSDVDSLQSDCECETRTDQLACIRLLLENGADPILGDNCLCACSHRGCNPSTAILKLSRWDSSLGLKFQKDVWTLEWLSPVHQYKGDEVARQCLLDLIRWIKFEELKLTHTCHCEDDDITSSMFRRNPVDPDDIDEIRDEEKIIIGELEEHMQTYYELIIDDLENIWIQTLSHYDHAQKARFREDRSERQRDKQLQRSCKPLRDYPNGYYIDHKNDKFVSTSSFGWQPSPKCYDLGVDRYLYWIDYCYRNASDPKPRMDEWYNKIKRLIERLVQLGNLNPSL